MPTTMSYKKIRRPKNRTPKYSLIRSTSYHITTGSDGKTKITKTVIKKFRVNKV